MSSGTPARPSGTRKRCRSRSASPASFASPSVRQRSGAIAFTRIACGASSSASAAPPARSISAAVACAEAASSSRTASRAPKAASPRAIPLPMPAPAPVTSATRPVRDAFPGSIALLRRVADEDALAVLEAGAELVREARPALGVLAGVLVHQALLGGRVTDHLAPGLERRPVGLADRDARPGSPPLDAPHAPGGGRRAHVHGLAVVVEPDLRGLPERARFPLALDVDVLGLVQRAVELGREPGACARDQRDSQDEDGDAAHGNLLGGQAADLTAGRAADASGRRARWHRAGGRL